MKRKVLALSLIALFMVELTIVVPSVSAYTLTYQFIENETGYNHQIYTMSFDDATLNSFPDGTYTTWAGTGSSASLQLLDYEGTYSTNGANFDMTLDENFNVITVSLLRFHSDGHAADWSHTFPDSGLQVRYIPGQWYNFIGNTAYGVAPGWNPDWSLTGNWVAVNTVPEPTTIALLGVGLAGLGIGYLRRRRRQRREA